MHRILQRVFSLAPRRSWTTWLAVILLLGVCAESSRACWQTMLLECFNRPATQWPWQNPVGVRTWRTCVFANNNSTCYPSIPNTILRWGINTDYYTNVICSPGQPYSDQSAWCLGQPVGQDPEFDVYPSNMNTYMTYGPLNLSTAAAARVLFWLYNESEFGHDSVYWGAANDFLLTSANMRVGGTLSGPPIGDEFNMTQMNLDSLTLYTNPDSVVSMLGLTTVYVFWRFVSDGNAIRDIGAFVDDVLISIDDGGLDVAASGIDLYKPDSVEYNHDPGLNDTAWARFTLSTCEGGTPFYDPFRVIGRLTHASGVDTLLDTLMVGIESGDIVSLTTPLWVVSEPGDYLLQFTVDADNVLTETNENNNTSSNGWFVAPPNDPPSFQWIVPSGDTLFADTEVTIRWFCDDPDEAAFVTISYDQNNSGCSGVALPGGANRPEIGLDSIVWNTSAFPEERVYWFFARVFDSANDTCIYTDMPMVVRHLDAVSIRDGVPQEYFLEQNYPNPFNPNTDISFGITRAGSVRLTVFDLLGREVAVLVNEPMSPGYYKTPFSAAQLSSGIYLYRLESESGVLARKMMLLK